MAPRRRIVRKQLEVMIDFLEENKELAKGVTPGAPVAQQASKQKWTVLAKRLNTVEGGSLKTPDHWKKYWFEWRHKCRKKASDARRYATSSQHRFTPLNDLEIRVLELSGKVAKPQEISKELESFLADNSDSDKPLEPAHVQIESTSSQYHVADGDTQSEAMPPRWALDLENRRIAAEERMATAMESLASTLKSQEERRCMLDERIADAIAVISGSVQDLNSGIQDVIQQVQQHIQTNGLDIKGVFI